MHSVFLHLESFSFLYSVNNTQRLLNYTWSKAKCTHILIKKTKSLTVCVCLIKYFAYKPVRSLKFRICIQLYYEKFCNMETFFITTKWRHPFKRAHQNHSPERYIQKSKSLKFPRRLLLPKTVCYTAFECKSRHFHTFYHQYRTTSISHTHTQQQWPYWNCNNISIIYRPFNFGNDFLIVPNTHENLYIAPERRLMLTRCLWGPILYTLYLLDCIL